MKAQESQVGLVFCACWNDHISLKWRKCGMFPIILMSCLFMSIFLPYITMVAKNLLPPFLPLVSDAGGYPPSCGIFGLFLLLAAFFSLPSFPLVYETVNHRIEHNWIFIRLANKIAFVVIAMSFFGLVITACNPVAYTDIPNKFEWMMTVLGEHGIGAILILVGVGVYQYFIAAIWWYLPGASKADRFIKIGLVAIYTILFLLTLYPLPAMILEELGSNPFDFTHMKKTAYDLPRVYSTNHLICSICEYIICILSAVNIGLLSKELQKVSISVVLQHKPCRIEAKERLPSIKLRNIS